MRSYETIEPCRFAAFTASIASPAADGERAAKMPPVWNQRAPSFPNSRSQSKSIGGQKKAREVNREIARHVDVMVGNEEDFTASLGFEVKGAGGRAGAIDTDAFKAMIGVAVGEFKNFKVAATTLRRVISATRNDWSAVLWHDGAFHESRKYPDLEILDRVGGGDSFASGMQFGFLEFNDAQKAVDYGAAHGALASTTPGDTSMATRAEVERLFSGAGARIVR